LPDRIRNVVCQTLVWLLIAGLKSGIPQPALAQPEAQPLAFILMYHHVADTVQPGPYARALTVTPQEFARHLAWLRAHGCEAVTVNTIVNDAVSHSVRGCEVAITIDDGYDDAAAHALPLLRQFGAVATFYVTSGFLNDPGHLSGSQVKRLADAGMEIGAHTIDHLDLTALGDAEAAHQIGASGQVLKELTGASVSTFAYPSGQLDARVERLVKAAGLRNATSTQPGTLTAPGALQDLYALPRYRIERDTGMSVLQRIVGGAKYKPLRGAAESRSIARKRVEGNDAPLAERIGAALLDASYPEQLLKVRVLRTSSAIVVGIVLSAEKPHGALTRASVLSDVAGMIDRAFAASPAIAEVDVWASKPLPVQQKMASGDLAEPSVRTVFSAAVTRGQRETAASRAAMLQATYFDPSWLREA